MNATVIVIAARMASRRLPGKVLRPLAGRPLLAYSVERARACREADVVLVATSDLPQDDAVADWAQALGVACHRGSEMDVVARHAGAAAATGAQTVVRVTADCPFLDPVQTDAVIRAFHAHPGTDFATNILERSVPRGLDVEVFSRALVDQLHQAPLSALEREHMDLHLLAHPERFAVVSVSGPHAASALRLTVDTPQDLALARQIAQALDREGALFTLDEILALLASHPDWAAQNQGVQQFMDDPLPGPGRWRSFVSVRA